MSVLINKEQAVQTVGSEEELRRATELYERSGGEMFRLYTGAKLFVTRRGAVRRYGIYGYDDDESDVKRVLLAIEAGASPLLFGSRHPRS